jgi:hypothetical protein
VCRLGSRVILELSVFNVAFGRKSPRGNATVGEERLPCCAVRSENSEECSSREGAQERPAGSVWNGVQVSVEIGSRIPKWSDTNPASWAVRY